MAVNHFRRHHRYSHPGESVPRPKEEKDVATAPKEGAPTPEEERYMSVLRAHRAAMNDLTQLTRGASLLHELGRETNTLKVLERLGKRSKYGKNFPEDIKVLLRYLAECGVDEAEKALREMWNGRVGTMKEFLSLYENTKSTIAWYKLDPLSGGCAKEVAAAYKELENAENLKAFIPEGQEITEEIFKDFESPNGSGNLYRARYYAEDTEDVTSFKEFVEKKLNLPSDLGDKLSTRPESREYMHITRLLLRRSKAERTYGMEHLKNGDKVLDNPEDLNQVVNLIGKEGIDTMTFWTFAPYLFKILTQEKELSHEDALKVVLDWAKDGAQKGIAEPDKHRHLVGTEQYDKNFYNGWILHENPNDISHLFTEQEARKLVDMLEEKGFLSKS